MICNALCKYIFACKYAICDGPFSRVIRWPKAFKTSYKRFLCFMNSIVICHHNKWMEWREWHPFILEDFWPLFAGPAVDVDGLPVHVHQPHHLLLVEAGLGPGAHLRAHQYNILLQMSDLTTLLTTYAANSGNVGIKLSRSSVRNLFFICRAIANLLGWKSGVLGSLASLSYHSNYHN